MQEHRPNCLRWVRISALTAILFILVFDAAQGSTGGEMGTMALGVDGYGRWSIVGFLYLQSFMLHCIVLKMHPRQGSSILFSETTTHAEFLDSVALGKTIFDGGLEGI